MGQESLAEGKREQKIIEKIWSRVKKKHLFPEIPLPKITSQKGGVAIEMKDKQITVNPSCYQKIGGKMSEEEIIEAFLDHGVSHYTYCPWDFSNHLSLYFQAKKVVRDKKMAQRITGYFMDVVANTHCFRGKETKIAELYKHLEKGKLDQAISALYQKIWGVDLNVSGHEELVRRLSRIPYLEKREWGESIKKFARGLKLLLEEEREEKGGEESGENPLGDHKLSSYSREEIEEGLKNLAYQSLVFGGKDSSGEKGIEEFREVVGDFEEELQKMGFGPSKFLEVEGGMGRGRGSSIDADLLFYMKLAENYNLPIQKMPLEKSGFLNPYSHLPWEIGKPFQDIDVWTSFGKIMPGITQSWKKVEGEVLGEKEGIPDCIIMIDSSGSMINPRKKLSYAVLGAACAADSYLRWGSQVAVYNFSDAQAGGKEILDFTKERLEVYRVLCRYFGGGTQLQLEDLDSLRKGRTIYPKPDYPAYPESRLKAGSLVEKRTSPSAKGEADIFLITDMQITNLEIVLEYLTSVENSRITAVHLGDNRHTLKFKEAAERRSNMSIYSVDKKEDIPKIVLGKVKEYFYQRY